MKLYLVGFCVLFFSTGLGAFAAQPALTIYNGNFAVVRERVALDLPAGTSPLTFSGVTTQLEPDSVVLRDPTGRVALRILEQSYRAETASPGLMLSVYEGREVDFLVRDERNREHVVRGRVVRSGWLPGGGSTTPVVEVDGKLRFSLPGEPVFPQLADDAILEPQLGWQLHVAEAAQLEAEVSYLTSGLSWQAAYNFMLPERGDQMDVIGWVTVQNTSGKRFDEAAVKLMAGDVHRVQPEQEMVRARGAMMAMMADAPAEVTQRAFDEFHLYSLPRPLTVRDQETKQVEFMRASNVPVTTIYVYEGAAVNAYHGWGGDALRTNPEYGTQSNRSVRVYREFENSREVGLGVPLPAGRTRFYRSDETDDSLQFTGENTIKHTPQGETVRLYTGDAFDIVGERKRTDFVLSNRQDTADEGFEIRIRNRKSEPVEVRVVERLYRGVNWEIVQRSDAFERTDAQTVEFRVTVAPDEEKVVTYRVRYTWR